MISRPFFTTTFRTLQVLDADAGAGDGTGMHAGTEYEPELERRFMPMCVMTACFMAFTHGANDIANAAGPLVAIWVRRRVIIVLDQFLADCWSPSPPPLSLSLPTSARNPICRAICARQSVAG